MNTILNNGWIEDVGTWLLGLAAGLWWAHRKVIRPALAQHEELRRRLEHIIEHHPSIPPLPPKGP